MAKKPATKKSKAPAAKKAAVKKSVAKTRAVQKPAARAKEVVSRSTTKIAAKKPTRAATATKYTESGAPWWKQFLPR
jgi:hypothetical protein